MGDLEERLRRARRAEPSPDLDTRLDKLLSGHETTGDRIRWQRAIPLWQCVTACAVCALTSTLAMSLLADPEPAATDPPTIYVVYPASDDGVNVFDYTQMPQEPVFPRGPVTITIEEPNEESEETGRTNDV